MVPPKLKPGDNTHAHNLTMTTPPPKIRLNPEVIFSVLGDETVLLHLKTEEYYTLDETGTRMWQLLTEYCEPEPVIARMLDEFEVDEGTVRSDLNRLITDGKAEGLLDVGE
jgi:hypothetical protein